MLNIDGLDIYFKHNKDEWGFITANRNGKEFLTPYKGVTTCYIKRGEETIAEASGFCGQTDKFNKSVGRKVSLTKALHGFDKEFRTNVWNLYFETVGKQ